MGFVAAGGGHGFILPMIQGFVGELGELVFSKGSQWAMGSLTLVSRRSVQRIGTRHWRRGADKEVCCIQSLKSMCLSLSRRKKNTILIPGVTRMFVTLRA